METNALKVNKKQFSRIGMTMFLATLILNGIEKRMSRTSVSLPQSDTDPSNMTLARTKGK